MLLNTIETYEQLQTFNDIDSLNHAVKHHKRLIASNKQKNVHAVLDLISQYSCVHFGVSWLSQNTIADELGVSYKTVQRAINKLIELNIIVKHACKRVSGDKRQTSNIYVIQPIEASVQAEVSGQEAPHLNSKNINNTRDTKKAVINEQVDKESLIKDGLVAKLPTVLQRALAPFFDADKVYELAGVIFKAKSAIDRTIKLEDNELEYYNAILSVINAYKRGKVINLSSLIYYAVKTATHRIKASMRVSLFLDLVVK